MGKYSRMLVNKMQQVSIHEC